MKFRKFGFTLVEALVIMVVVAILLAAATPLITRKVIKLDAKAATHGRYEAFYKDNGGTPEAWERLYYGDLDTGGAKLHKIYERKCTHVATDGATTCYFEPPIIAKNYLVQAAGGGGAGGGAGDSFQKSLRIGQWDQTQGLKNDGSRANVVRIWKNLDGLNVVENESWAKEQGLAGYPGKNFPDNVRWKFYINDGSRSINGLGSPKQNPKTDFVPNWFDWHTLNRKYNSNAYDVVLTACSGRGGDGGDLYWTADGGTSSQKAATGGGDYDSLRAKYTSRPIENYSCSSNGTCCCSWYSCNCNQYGCSSCCGSYCTSYRATWTDVCIADGTYYTCGSNSNSSITYQSKNRSATSCGSCPGASNSYSVARRQPLHYSTNMIGDYGEDGAIPKTSSNIENNNNWGCVSLSGNIVDRNMQGSAQIITNPCSYNSYGGNRLNPADVNGKVSHNFLYREQAKGTADKGTDYNLDSWPVNPVGRYTSDRSPFVSRWLGAGPSSGCHGATGRVALAGKPEGQAVGGTGGAGACQKWKCATSAGAAGVDITTLPPVLDGENYRDACHKSGRSWFCYYDSTIGGYLDRHFNQRIDHVAGTKGGYRPPASPAASSKTGPVPNDQVKLCSQISSGKSGDTQNYCRTGRYNDEYAWTMFKVEKFLSYGDSGEPGAFVSETLTDKITGNIEVRLGKGGDWGTEPDKDGKKPWLLDKTADGPNGKDTYVGNTGSYLLTAQGGKGGKGAIRTDVYQLCNIDDKGITGSKMNSQHDSSVQMCSNDERIQEGTEGQKSGFNTTSQTNQEGRGIMASKGFIDLNPGKGGNGAGSISKYEYECTPRTVVNMKYSNNQKYTTSEATQYGAYHGYIRNSANSNTSNGGNPVWGFNMPVNKGSGTSGIQTKVPGLSGTNHDARVTEYPHLFVYNSVNHVWKGDPEHPTYGARTNGALGSQAQCIGGTNGVNIYSIVDNTNNNMKALGGTQTGGFYYITAPLKESKYFNRYYYGRMKNKSYGNYGAANEMEYSDTDIKKELNGKGGAVVITW